MKAEKKSVADNLYDKVVAVSAENQRMKYRLNRIWVKAIEGQASGPGKGGGAVAWRDALIEIEALAK